MATKKISVVATIDTGVDLGLAVWEYAKMDRLCPPIHTAVIKSKPPEDGMDDHSSWIYRMSTTAEELRRQLMRYELQQVWVEWPGFFDTALGHAVAKTGDLTKLCASAGWILAVCSSRCVAGASGLNLVPVIDWKGQLPKPVVNTRIKKLFPKSVHSTFKSHVWDAVGIGLWVKGYFN